MDLPAIAFPLLPHFSKRYRGLNYELFYHTLQLNATEKALIRNYI